MTLISKFVSAPAAGFISAMIVGAVLFALPIIILAPTEKEGKVCNQAVSTLFAPQGQYDRLPVFATDLVRQKVAVIVSSGGDVAALSAKAATSSIPIVTVSGTDPVKAGLVASFNRPGGNITGASFVATELETKRLELLRDLVPAAAMIGLGLTIPPLTLARADELIE